MESPMSKKKEIKSADEKAKQSGLEHLARLANAIMFGGNHFIPKTHWCEEHQEYEY
jgi:hypothetical protein